MQIEKKIKRGMKKNDLQQKVYENSILDLTRSKIAVFHVVKPLSRHLLKTYTLISVFRLKYIILRSADRYSICVLLIQLKFSTDIQLKAKN